MKKKTTTITKEYDQNGKLVSEVTETTEEEDGGYIYPQQYYPSYPVYPVTVTGKPDWTYRDNTNTCDTHPV